MEIARTDCDGMPQSALDKNFGEIDRWFTYFFKKFILVGTDKLVAKLIAKNYN